MDQHAAPIIVINNENIVPTVKKNTVSSLGITFINMEDLVTCKAFISTSKDPIIGTSQKGKQFQGLMSMTYIKVDQEPILRGQAQIQQGSKIVKSIHGGSGSLSRAI